MIDAHDGCDANGRACKEEFVTYIKFAAVDRSFDDVQPHFTNGKFRDAMPRDAFEGVLRYRRRDQFAVAHHEDVASGAFGDVSVFVEEDGFVEACLPCVVAGECAVHIGAADFGASRNRIVFDPTPGAYACMQPLITLQILAEGKGHEGKRILIVGADADAFGRLVGQRPDVDVGAKRVATHQFDGDGAKLRHSGGNVNAQDAAVFLPAFVVFRGAQDEQFVFGGNPMCADAFKNAGTVVQSVGKDIDLRIAQRHVFAIEKHNQIRIGGPFHCATSLLRDSR